MHNKLAHTAEHAFIGSLQRILGTTLKVRKVEHREKDSSVIINLSNLDPETVIEAQYKVNALIYSGRKVKTHSFETMEKARLQFPELRANEERIKLSDQPIRVIEIEGHDIAACAMNHVSDLRECEFFFVTRISRLGGAAEYEINFAVQNQAKEASTILSRKLLHICHYLGANMNTIENTVKKLNQERKLYATKIKRLTIEYLNKIEPTVIDENGKVNLIDDIMYGLDDEEIRSFVGKKASATHEDIVVLIVHIRGDEDESASVYFARTQSLKPIDCNKLFNQYSYLGVKGGGKPTFVTGIIHKEKTKELMKHLIMDVRKTLQ
ncbi:MAG: DHHA1 domain-containing protein [Nitrososphaeraceae archaeon]